MSFCDPCAKTDTAAKRATPKLRMICVFIKYLPFQVPVNFVCSCLFNLCTWPDAHVSASGLQSPPSLFRRAADLVGLRIDKSWYNTGTLGWCVAKMGDVTEVLHKWREGSHEAENELFAMVLPNLRRLAHYLMQGERKGHSLQPTELVDQVYFRLVAAKNRDWQNRRHFFAIAGRAMRRHLIDHARGRPDAEFITLEGIQNLLPADSAKVDLAITIDRLLDRLAATKPEWCTLGEMKYFL